MKMRTTKLFTSSTVVVRLIITLVSIAGTVATASYSLSAFAQDAGSAPPPPGVTTANFNSIAKYCLPVPTTPAGIANCNQAKAMANITDPNAATCSTYVTNYQTAIGIVSDKCGGTGVDSISSCVQRNAACQASTDDLGAQVESDQDNVSQDADALSGVCDAATRIAATACKYKFAGTTSDLKSDQASADSDVTDAQKTVDDLQTQLAQTQSDLQSAPSDHASEVQQAQLDYAAKLLQISQNVAHLNLDNESGQMQAINTANAQLAALIAQDKQAQAAYNQDNDAVVAAQNNVIAVCRAYAMTMYNTANAALQGQLTSILSNSNNQGSLANLAGYTNTLAKVTQNQRGRDYAGYYNDCANGIAPDGASAIAAVKNAIQKQQTDQKNLALQEQSLQLQEKNVTTALANQAAVANAQLKQEVKDAQNQQALLVANNAIAVQKDQAAYDKQMQQLSLKQTQLQSQLAQAEKILTEKQHDQSVATALVACSEKNGGHLSQTAGDEAVKGYADGAAAISQAIAACSEMNLTPACSSQYAGFAPTCTALNDGSTKGQKASTAALKKAADDYENSLDTSDDPTSTDPGTTAAPATGNTGGGGGSTTQ